MSLLKALRIPQLRSASRTVLAARMASLPGGQPFEGSPFGVEESIPNYEDLPPRGPESAYPPAPPNPFTQTRNLMPQPRRKDITYSLHVHSDSNNNILTFTRPDGSPIMNVSGGQVGYKHKARGTAEAAHLCALKAFKRIEEEQARVGSGNMALDVLFNGFGRGRDAVHKALLAAEAATVREIIQRVTDITRIKIGGTRSKKARRM